MNVQQRMLLTISRCCVAGEVLNAAIALGITMESGPDYQVLTKFLLLTPVFAVGWAALGVLARLPQKRDLP